MPPLRSHKKSRLGCLQCKKRRVKCDENGPPCSSCTFRKVECVYPDNASSSTSGTSPQTQTQSPTPQSQQPATERKPVDPKNLPVLDPSNTLSLELMHKYSTETYKSICSSPADSAAWQVTIPQRALHFPFLMDGLLSVAALHTATTKGPEEASEYIDMAVGFQTRSLEPFQRSIQHISPENCDAVFAYSIFTIVHGIAVPELTYITRASSTAATDTSSRLERIFVLFELVQGTAEINKMFGQTLQRTFHNSEDYWAGSSTALEAEDNEAFHRLHDINNQENHDLDPRKFQLMEDAIAQLRMCCQRYRGHQDPGSVLTWLAIVDREFVRFLREKDILAILMLVHWGFLLGQLDGKAWWALRFGLALVNEGLESLNQETHVYATDLTAAWLAYRNALSVFSHGAC
ncbi:hypothetical protein BJX66DRAFT_301854 [Aspergillus keveii]|uniref:Zn(2)-C6 fungal-type domain-containing protein n=1 Tax=Aspergillus keveii TaxID=714993 RepID=A0ABR4G978_9EURO